MSAPAGWYPDPGGQSGLYRFWNGGTWSATTTDNPASPPPYGAGPPDTPAAVTSAPEQLVVNPYDPTRGRSTTRWFLTGGAVLLALVVIVVLVVRGLGGPDDPGPTGPTPGAPSAQTCPDAGSPSASPPPETAGRVRSGSLSYPALPAPFSPPGWEIRVPFGQEVRSQNATVETSTDGRTIWEASVLIARLLAGDGFFGPEQGAKIVTTCVIGKFYGNVEVTRDDRRNAAITVDGRPAWIIESHLTFVVPGIETTGETMIVVVVDTGAGEAGLFYASIPDSSPQFLAPARRSLADLEVS